MLVFTSVLQSRWTGVAPLACGVGGGVVTLGEGGITADDVLVHDETNRALAHMLVALEPPAFPVALGVIYCSPVPSFEAEVYAQASAASAGRGAPDLAELFVTKEGTWTVS